jgi:hypothetical protein
MKIVQGCRGGLPDLGVRVPALPSPGLLKSSTESFETSVVEPTFDGSPTEEEMPLGGSGVGGALVSDLSFLFSFLSFFFAFSLSLEVPFNLAAVDDGASLSV